MWDVFDFSCCIFKHLSATVAASKADIPAMQHGAELTLARQILSEAEAALNLQIHRAEYDHQRCTELAEAVRIARDEYLDQLSSLWSESD